MLLARSVLFQIWMYGLMGLMGLVMAPLAIWSRGGAYYAIGRYLDLVFWGLRRLCGLTYEVRGVAPTGDVIIASQHQSFLDILIALRVLPQAKFVMKRSLVWAPILGFYAMRIGASPVARGKGSESFDQLMRGVAKLGDRSGQLVIYPQGTRVPPGETGVFRAGVHAIYQESRLPCIPAAVNTGRFWPRKGLIRRPGVAVMEFLEPAPPDLRGKEFMATLERRISEAARRLDEEALASLSG